MSTLRAPRWLSRVVFVSFVTALIVAVLSSLVVAPALAQAPPLPGGPGGSCGDGLVACQIGTNTACLTQEACRDAGGIVTVGKKDGYGIPALGVFLGLLAAWFLTRRYGMRRARHTE
jgi:hypothetical protein